MPTHSDFTYSLHAPRSARPDQLKTVTFWEDYNHFEPEEWLKRMQGEGHRVCLRANDASFVLQAIRTGVGKGIVPDFLAAGKSDITRISGKQPEFVRTLKLLHQPDMRKLARIEAVVTWLLDVFGSLPGTLGPGP